MHISGGYYFWRNGDVVDCGKALNHYRYIKGVPMITDKLAVLEKTMRDILAQIDEMKMPKEWPEHDDNYFFNNSLGRTQREPWSDMCCDIERQAIGNCYHTKEEAEREIRCRKVLVKMRGMTKGFVPDWDDKDQYKWFPIYDHILKKWLPKWVISYQEQFLFPFFNTPDNCCMALDALGDEMNVFWDCEMGGGG